jgi:phosphoribosyl-AMP cyclohydrolase
MDSAASTQYNRLITLKKSSFKQTLDLPAPTTTTKSSGTETKTQNAPILQIIYSNSPRSRQASSTDQSLFYSRKKQEQEEEEDDDEKKKTHVQV